ncbi:hypothetical protein DICVIV_10445 [Dictyocaulus viviparus]|uniref:CDK5 regulatory subunit-associated protein 3 n=1 Tax=Dictyocaulus viviparus TaxID=29172 RepID=A0A0D8XIC8_DICVI|nr:hypothetical protein DICVIV_10445 [Dictyocaulus viviparus]
MVNVQDIPIDIHSSKLLDWLISRRHCQKDWQKNVLGIREKIKNAILDMPESQEIVQLLQGTCVFQYFYISCIKLGSSRWLEFFTDVNYFHCRRIVEILQDTEKNTKNFLGFYSSQRMKDWLEIQSLYQKNNVYLAESAQILQRLVQYEIPSLKKQITKAEQALVESAKKEKEYGKQAEDGRKMYEQELLRIGIQGHSLRAELLALAAGLTSFFAEITKDIISLKEPYEYYINFRQYIHQRSDSQVNLLPVVNLLLKKGLAATVFEYKYGVAPDTIETPSYDLLLKEDQKQSDDEIDFCDDSLNFENEEVLGFAVDAQIDVVGDSSGLCAGAVTETVARGEDAFCLVESLDTQKIIRNELNELLAFLVMRKEDDERDSPSDIFIRGFEKRPSGISKISPSQIEYWISEIKAILNQLLDEKKNYLFRIRSSQQYVEKVVEEIEAKKGLEDRYKKMQALMVERQDEARQQIAKAHQHLHVVLNSTKLLQQQLEKEISLKYDGRKVNIMGAITSALAN